MILNINENVEITLTEYGVELYNKAYECVPVKWRRELHAGDTLRLQLWSVMNIFGPAMNLGNPRLPAFTGSDLKVVVR